MRVTRVFLWIMSLALLAGCAGTKPARMRTFNIAGNRAVDLPVDANGAPLPVETDDFRIEVAGYVLDAENRELAYTFALRSKHKTAPRSVTVEDVSGAAPEMLVSDSAPDISTEGVWKGNSIPKQRFDPSIGWVTDLGDTIRVFRFQVITADGRPYIIHQAAIWPGEAKAFVREIMGYDTPDQRLKK
jgi:hypothetical protein